MSGSFFPVKPVHSSEAMDQSKGFVFPPGSQDKNVIEAFSVVQYSTVVCSTVRNKPRRVVKLVYQERDPLHYE